jgi:hypothetical protein
MMAASTSSARPRSPSPTGARPSSARSGLIPLIHRKNTDKAAFIGAQSLYRPKKMSTDDATASENLSSRLPYMFAVSRFAHYLKCMVRDKIGSTKERAELQAWLQEWITRYIDGDPRLVRAHQGGEAAGRRARRDRRGRGEPGLLLGAVLPAAALPVGRHGYRYEPCFPPARKRLVSVVEGGIFCADDLRWERTAAARHDFCG